MRRIVSLSLVLMVSLGCAITFDLGYDVLTQKAQGATLYVGGSGGGNYTTIQVAIDDADPQDTVFIYSGHYSESLFINKTLNLKGESRFTTIINSSGNTYGIHIKNSESVTVSSLTVQKANSANIKITFSNNTRIHSAILRKSRSHAIAISPGSDNIIENNHIVDNNQGIDISNYSSSGNIIRGNIIESTENRAIILQSNAFDNRVFDNTITDFNEAGIYIYESQGNTIMDNQISDGNEGIRIINVNDLVFTNNIISGNDIAAKIIDDSNVTLSNCTLEDSTTWDLLLGDTINGNAHVTLINTTFDVTKVDILDSGTTLTIYWFLDVTVVDDGGNPQPQITVTIIDNDNGSFNETYTTDSQGRLDRLTLLEFFEDQTQKIYLDPYNVTAQNATVLGYASPEVRLDGTKSIEVKVTSIVVEPSNHPPQITVIEPTASNPTMKEGESLVFEINESDPDPSDTLQITWYFDNGLVQTGESSYTYSAGDLAAGNHVVKVVVDDGKVSVEQSWTVTVKDVVKDKEELMGLSYDSWTFIILIIIFIIIVIILLLIYRKIGKKPAQFDEKKTE
jgi:parallel beta-helix repeat protein